ncbi:hypothetical protein ACT453_32800, partial [Bacillus sp. D-CC]
MFFRTLYAESNQKLDYPSNRNKPFVSEDVFYKQLDKKIYKEYNNAAYSVRKKILFKEVPDEEFSFLQKTAVGCRSEVVLQESFIHPDRHVLHHDHYFLFSHLLLSHFLQPL